jgi:hypothetical protein
MFIFLAASPIKITKFFAAAFSLEVSFIDKDVVSVIHAIELEKLIDELQAHKC